MDTALINEIIDYNEIRNLCITCLSKTKRRIDLSDFLFDDQKYILIKVILEKIMSTKVLSYYPNVICVDCLASLKAALKLKQMFENSIQVLRKWLDAHEHPALVDSEDEKYSSVEKMIVSEKIERKDIFIVEEDSKENGDYSNFLKNLGDNITVNFVKEEPPKEQLNPEISIPNRDLTTTDGNSKSKALKRRVILSSYENVAKKKERISCQNCQKVYLSKARYTNHVRICGSTCRNCSKKLPNVETLKKHMLTCENDGNFECNFCTKRFESRERKNAHTKFHKLNEYKCNICDAIFCSHAALSYHKTSHNKGIQVVCPICGKGFNYRNGLFYHLRIHQNIRNYVCTYCPKKCLTMSSLKRHERTHTGERPYFCSFCPKSFSSSTEVKTHEMRHTGQKPHVCTYCKNRFVTMYHLKLHMSTHAGSYPCGLCKKSYLNEHVLKLHLKFKHNIKDQIKKDENE